MERREKIGDGGNAEQAPQLNEASYRALAEESPDHLFVIDRTFRVEFVNKAAAAQLGRLREDIIGRGIDEIFPQPVAERMRGNLGKVFTSGEPFLGEGPIPYKEGERVMSTRLMPLRDHAGIVTSVIGMSRDITDRRMAEKALKASEEMHRLVLQHIDEIVYVLKAPLEEPLMQKIGFMSSRVKDIIGYAPEEFLENPSLWLAALHPEDRPAAESHTREVFAGRQLGQFEYRMRHKISGEYRWLEDRLTLRVDPSSRILSVFGVARDVSERKRLEQQYLQAQKMEAIGRLAGGVAHDFNNLLTAILGYSHLLAGQLKEGHPHYHEVNEIRKAGERAAALTRQLLAFSRKQVLLPQLLDLNAVVAETDMMLRRVIGEDIVLETRLGPGLQRVLADPGQIELVMMNLAVNARDAMPQGGRLTVETRNMEIDESARSAHSSLAVGSYVMLAVEDTGTGMDQTTRSHLFEPFFTTKEKGKGTGLGLATVYGIVKQSGGDICVHTEAGKGSRFELFLPVAGGHSTASVTGSSEDTNEYRGTETILLVEDEDAVRELACGILQARGYHVLQARDGEVALRAADHAPVNLLLTDVVMPGLSGPALAERVREVRPDVRILYMSGYADDALPWHDARRSGVFLLNKPFTPQALARLVREVLDGPGVETSGRAE